MTSRRIFRFSPTSSRILRKARLSGPLSEAASETIELHPATTASELPAIALSGEFDRIKQPRHQIPMAQLETALSGGPTMHAATIGYRFTNALLADGSIYVGYRYETVAQRPRYPLIFGAVSEYDTAQLCADAGADVFFGRWLINSLTKELLAQEQCMQPINQPNAIRIHEAGYRSLLNLYADAPDRALFTNLWIVDDRGYNTDHVRRFRALRQRLPQSKRRPDKLVYLGRGKIGVPGRDIAAEETLQDTLANAGFTIIHPELMSAWQIQRALGDARLVLAVEGSAIAHALLAMPSGGAIVTLQPDNRFSTAHKSIAEFAGIRFAFLVATSTNLGLSVDDQRLMRLIDVVQQELSRCSAPF